MGSSAKKKARKAADFKKTKLRVGKASVASNATNTTFRSKPLVLASQSLHLSAPSATAQSSHHLSLLSHHSSSTRRESLNHLTAHLPSPSCIPKLLSLLCDPSKSVRTTLLTLLRRYPPDEMAPFAGSVRLYLWSAMSHLEPEVRWDATRFLGWGMEVLGAEVVADGGWRRGLGCWIGVVEQGAGREGLEVLRAFLECGVREEAGREMQGGGGLWGGEVYTRRVGVRGYRGLGLFGGGVEEGGEDAESRRRWLGGEGKDVVRRLRAALGKALKDGGEVGRTAKKLLGVLDGLGEKIS